MFPENYSQNKCLIKKLQAEKCNSSKNIWSLIWDDSRLFRGFEEDYVNDKESALSASFSKSWNLEDMTQFPCNFSVIKID